MKLRKAFALFFLTSLLAAHSQAQGFSGKVFSGTINNRYPIRMTLNRQGATITGSYLYTRVGKSITLRGEIQDDGFVLLFEVNDKGINTGVFRGAFENNHRFSGTWSEPDGSRKMPFEVTLDASASTEGSVILEEKKVILKHSTKDKDDYQEAVVSFPLVKGEGPIAAKIQKVISLKAVFDQSLEELTTEFQESFWLIEISYQVNYNKNFILDITFNMEGVGAYPDTMVKHIVVNLKTGDPLRAVDVFNASSLKTIALMVNRRMQADIRETIRAWAKDAADIKNLFEGKQFTEADLDNFSVSDRGVTFLYDFAFAHVVKAAEPEGAYLFTFQQLKPYIRRDGLLAIFL